MTSVSFLRKAWLTPLLLLFVIPPANSATNVAVMDLQPVGDIRKGLAALLSDVLRSELYKTGAFEIMNREDMDAILKEIKYQQSGACDTTTCVVEMGQALGVQRIVAGSIGFLGKKYALTLKLVGIAQSKNELILTEYHAGSEDDLSGFMAELAKKLAEHKLREGSGEPGPHRKSVVVAGLLGILPGAGQFYNGQKLKGYLFAAAEVATLGGALFFYKEAQDAQDAYDVGGLGSDFPGLRDRATSTWKANRTLLYAATGVVTLSVVDSILGATRGKKKLALQISEGGVNVAYALDF